MYLGSFFTFNTLFHLIVREIKKGEGDDATL